MEPALLPWQTNQWQQLFARANEETLPHALLLAGPRGIGKNRFANRLVQTLLCAMPDRNNGPCGHCKSCILYQAESHPDVLVPVPKENNQVVTIRKMRDSSETLATPDEDNKAIGIDQIRDVIEFLALKSQYGKYKIVVISPATALNTNAANALLKALEEPAARTVLILVSERPESLLPTIRSRCQRIDFELPASEDTRQWLMSQGDYGDNLDLLLELAGGAPLAAKALSASGVVGKYEDMLGDLERLFTHKADPVIVAANWIKWGLIQPVTWLRGFIMDMIRLKSASEPVTLSHPHAQKQLQLFIKTLNLKELFGFLDRLNELTKLAGSQVNRQMLMEEALIYWSQLARISHKTAQARKA